MSRKMSAQDHVNRTECARPAEDRRSFHQRAIRRGRPFRAELRVTITSPILESRLKPIEVSADDDLHPTVAVALG